MTNSILQLRQAIATCRVIFWDFDGVIKDTISAKADVFEQVFSEYGEELSKRARSHHEKNGGLSRFEKIPLYLGWAGENVTSGDVERLCVKISENMIEKVVEANFVEGVLDLINSSKAKEQILVSATPTNELEAILEKINMSCVFRWVYGAPIDKTGIVKECLNELKATPQECILIGDSAADKKAAEVNGIRFILRAHSHNEDLQKLHMGITVKDFVANE
jgi:beta-phosphoglucomutase-like phosphatase (HAD superfamily)